MSITFTRALLAVALMGTAAAGPATCYHGCTDNGGIPSGGYLDDACEVQTCSASDTHCLSVYSTAASHSNSLNPVTGAMDATRHGTTDDDGRVIALGCGTATTKAALEAEYAKIYTNGQTITECTSDNCNKCQIESSHAVGTQKQCNYGNFAKPHWGKETCGIVRCAKSGSICMSITFLDSDISTTTGMGCLDDQAQATATCDSWKEHSRFKECSTACTGTTTAACNVCTVSAAMQTSPSVAAMAAMALVLSAASLVTGF